jgi:hypothetical protein
MSRIHQALARPGPFLLVRIEVDEIGRVNAKGYILRLSGFFYSRAGFLAHAHRPHPTQFQRK